MIQQMVITILLLFAAYAVLGVVFAVLFHFVGLCKLDHGVTGAGWMFRLLITPGIIALWPLLARRWRRAARGGSFAGDPNAPVTAGQLRARHRLLWKLLAVLMPLALAAALYWRPDADLGTSLKLLLPIQAQPR